MRENRFVVILALLSLAAGSSFVHATPYASNVVKTGTTVTYTLNEAADTLKFSINGGALNNVPDGTAKGSHTFTLGSATDTFSIVAEKTSAVGYTIPTGLTNPGAPTETNGFTQPTAQAGFNLISNDTDPGSIWGLSPRGGVDVNRNPNTANFGTYYVGANGADGSHTRGIFAYRADSSVAYGNGATGYNPMLPDGSTAAFTTASSNSPFHVTVAADGTLWESGYADANSNVLMLDPNLASPTAQNLFPYAGLLGNPFGLGIGPSPPVGDDPLTTAVETTFPTTPDQTALTPWSGCTNCTTAIQNHGSVASVYIEGSIAGGNLVVYTLDEDMNSAHAQVAKANGVGSTATPTTPAVNPDFNRDGKVNAADYVAWRMNKDGGNPGYNGNNGYADWRSLFGTNMFDRNGVWKYTIGSDLGAGSTGSLANPTQILGGVGTSAAEIPKGLIGYFDPGGIITDFTKGPDGKFYISESRGAGNEPGLVVADPSGNLLWSSLATSRTLLANPTAVDILAGVNEVQVTPDGKFLVIMVNSSDVGIIPLVGGIPDLANRMIVDSSTANAQNSGRDIAVDAAGNIYYVSSGQGLLRILSPGGHTVATTSWNGSVYSFGVAPGSGFGGAVPEPGTFVLALAGLAFAGCRRRR